MSDRAKMFDCYQKRMDIWPRAAILNFCTVYDSSSLCLNQQKGPWSSWDMALSRYITSMVSSPTFRIITCHPHRKGTPSTTWDTLGCSVGFAMGTITITNTKYQFINRQKPQRKKDNEHLSRTIMIIVLFQGKIFRHCRFSNLFQ